MARARSSFILKGDKAIIAQLKRRTGATFERVKQVQNDTARDIMRESNAKVPKDTYATVKSARMQEDRSRREIRTLGVTYDTDYAVALHEDMEARHDPGTGPKFLQRSALKQRRRYSSELKQAVAGGMS